MGSHEYSALSFSVDESVATITLNRPDKYNAINMAMHKDFQAALAQIRRDKSVRAVLISANGKGFCAGQDLTEFGVAQASEDFRVDDHVRNTFNKIVMGFRSLEIPVVAAVGGVAAGAGWSLALMADIRIASTDATFMQAFVKIGLIPDTGSTWFLPELIGTSRALELAMTGDPIDAQQAHDWGLVNTVVAPDELHDTATAYAQRLAGLPTRAIGLTKRAMYRSTTSTLSDALEYEAQLQQHAAQSSDHAEGVMAFLEKREPSFTGT